MLAHPVKLVRASALFFRVASSARYSAAEGRVVNHDTFSSTIKRYIHVVKLSDIIEWLVAITCKATESTTWKAMI